MADYNEDEVVKFVLDIKELTEDLGRLAVNAARMQFDAVTMGYTASRVKHLRELKEELYGPTVRVEFPHPLPGGPLQGAFCIPNCEVGDGTGRLWWPSFLGQPEQIQDRMIEETLRRGYNHGEIQVSGFAYPGYAEIPLDGVRLTNGLAKMRAAGLQTIVAFRDDRGPDLSYLRGVLEHVDDMIDWCMCIYEMNGVFRDAKICLDVVRQARALLPNCKLAFHTTAQDPGTESHGMIDWHAAKSLANLNAYFFQVSGWLPDGLKNAQDRIADWTRRLQGGFHGYPILSDGVVDFENTTSRTYRHEWSEAAGVQFTDRLMNAPLLPDEGFVSLRPNGFCDGGTPR